MKWVKVVRAIRGGVWGLASVAAVFTVGDLERRMFKYDISAMQQGARASIGMFELLGVLIVVLSIDRVLELRERGMLERGRPQEKEALER